MEVRTLAKESFVPWPIIRWTVIPRQGRTLLFLCSSVILIHIFANIVQFYPNQIWWGSVFLSIAITLFFLFRKKMIGREVFRKGFIVYLYFFYLGLTALWAKFPEDTLKAVKFDLIFILLFWLFYWFSANARTALVEKFFIIIPFLYFPFVAYYHMIEGVEGIRLGNPLQLSIAIPYIFSGLSKGSKKFLYALCLTLSLLGIIISMYKTIIFTAFFGLTASILISSGPFSLKRFASRSIMGMAIILVTLVIGWEIPILRDHLLSSVARFGMDVRYGDIRFMGEAEDVVRSNLSSYSIELLKDHWLTGIGYMNFMAKTGIVYGYSYYTTTGFNIGEEILGMNLHNSFMTWALEGGLACVLIVGIMLYKYFTKIIMMIRCSRDEAERSFMKASVIAMLQLLGFGFFHQVHATPQFWLMLGIVYGMNLGTLNLKRRITPGSPNH